MEESVLLLDATPLRAVKLQPFIHYLQRRFPPGQRRLLVEIGCFCGDSTMEFARVFDRVIAVDAWDVAQYPIGTPDAVARYGQEYLERAEATFDYNMHNFPNVVKCKMSSAEAATAWIANGWRRADVCYIDALHTEVGVTADMELWDPLTKSVVAGHDYNSRSWPGVVRAVHTRYNRPDISFPDSTWVCEKERRLLGPGRPLDPAELEQRVRIAAAVNKDENWEVCYAYEHKTGLWHVSVQENIDKPFMFGGNGVTVEEAARECWHHLLKAYHNRGFRLPTAYTLEATELQRAAG